VIFFVSLLSLKLTAFILLISTVAYMGEWVTLPGKMVPSSPKMCCGEAAKHSAHPACPKPEKESNGCANCCLNCPMCYTTILSPDNEAADLVVMVRKTYPGYRSDYTGEYHPDAWKPPNRG
jgi:hypothetical protein